jgi:hypothetical protein
VHTSGGDRARDGVIAAYRAYLHAMVQSDTVTLDELLADEFTLTHIGGHIQPKQEWLVQLRAGQFAYHDVQERTVSVTVNGDTARLVGQIVTDATVYGTRRRWQLRLSMDFEYRHGEWIAVRSLASTW